MRKDNRPSTLVEEAERLRSRAKMADDAVSTIATAAGLPADASAEEVVARVGEMRGKLLEMHAASVGVEGLSPAESSARWVRMMKADDAIDTLARRLAEEAGRG